MSIRKKGRGRGEAEEGVREKVFKIKQRQGKIIRKRNEEVWEEAVLQKREAELKKTS